MKKFVILFVLLSAFFVHSQVETLTGHSFFRDQMQQPGFQQNGPIICDVGFKKDTIKKTIGQKLKPHFMENYLFEVHDKNVNLYISPVVNLQLGQNMLEKDEAYLFQNTRGFYVKGEFLNNFSFSSTFVENQARTSLFYHEQRQVPYGLSSDMVE